MNYWLISDTHFAHQKLDDWATAGFDDSTWPPAKETVPFGANPWGMLAGQVTLSPVKADPFFGHCEISKASLKKSRIYLEVGALAPELAARVTVNGKDAGGFIGKPFRLDVTRLLKTGANSITITPFAPKSARLVVY